MKATMMHNSDDWKTPSNLYNAIMSLNYIDCFKFQSKHDEYEELYMFKRLFINPPYSHIKTKKFLMWLTYNLMFNEVLLLIPSRTDTKTFQELCKFNPKIYFFKGRLHFNDSKDSAPFPSLMMHFKLFEKNRQKNYQEITLDGFIELLKKGG